MSLQAENNFGSHDFGQSDAGTAFDALSPPPRQSSKSSAKQSIRFVSQGGAGLITVSSVAALSSNAVLGVVVADSMPSFQKRSHPNAMFATNTDIISQKLEIQSPNKLDFFRQTELKATPQRVHGSVQALKLTIESWRISPSQAATLLGLPTVAEVERIMSGVSPLRGRDIRDRARYIILIGASLASLLRNPKQEWAWLREPRESLDGKSPLDAMLEGAMEKLILIMEFLDHLSGR